MRVLVTGAYGLIGSAILARLHREGHEVVGTGRAIEAARRRFPDARWIAADFNRLTTADAWRPLLDGIDAVVNCAGAFPERRARRPAAGPCGGAARPVRRLRAVRTAPRDPDLRGRGGRGRADRVLRHQGAGRRPPLRNARSTGSSCGRGSCCRRQSMARPPCCAGSPGCRGARRSSTPTAGCRSSASRTSPRRWPGRSGRGCRRAAPSSSCIRRC